MTPMYDVHSAEQTAATPVAEDAIDELPLPYLEMDRRGTITRANRAALALHPPERGELVGQIAWELMAADEKDPSFAAYASLMESGMEAGERPAVVRRSLYDRSGSFRTYEMYRSLVRDAEGLPAGVRMLCVDITETKQALEEAKRSLQWLESVMASLPDAAIVTDALGFIRYANPAAEELFGWKAAELKGEMIERALPLASVAAEHAGALTFNMALESRVKVIGKVFGRKRSEVQVEIDSSPIVDRESGLISGVVSILRRVGKGG